MYLKIDKNKIPSSEAQIMINVTYYGNNTNSLWFNYNSTSNNYAGADFTKLKTDGWVTTLIMLTDANLKGAMNGGSDIRMGHNGGANYIKEVTVAIGALNPDAEPIPAKPNNPASEFKGKSFAGYQIWHEAGPNNSDWVHWSYGHRPGPGFHLYNGVDVSSYPDVSEFDESLLFQTNLGNLGNGNPAKLYNAKDAAIINKHMEWLQQVDFDGVAVQRFVGGIGKTVTSTDKSHLTYVKNACEATGRLFYICYDFNGADASIVQCMKMDWVYEIEQIRALTSSPNYATVNGKPVVELWGTGMDMVSPTRAMDIIQFLQSRGCYVIGGTPRDWRNPGAYADVYKQLDCISPWTIGVYGNVNGANDYYNNTMIPDKAYCDQYGMDYLPVVFAGSANWLTDNLTLYQNFRLGGELFWAQVKNAESLGLTSVYYAMLDEFEESTNLIKGAVDYFDIPVNQYFETFSRDGIWVSSDYYLRLSAYAAKMLRGEKPSTATIPIPYSEGPIYFRNSFESMLSTINKNGSGKGQGQQPDYSIMLPVDPCFYRNSTVTTTNGVGQCVIVEDAIGRKSGDYAVRFSVDGNNATYIYKTNETKIVVKENMKLSYYKYPVNELGRYAGVDLLFNDGTKLSDYQNHLQANGNIGVLDKEEVAISVQGTIGKTITAILMSYSTTLNGYAETYFDDIIIEDGSPTTNINSKTKGTTNVYASDGKIIIESQEKPQVSVYTISGQLVFQQKMTSDILSQQLNKGIYILTIENNRTIERTKIVVD